MPRAQPLLGQHFIFTTTGFAVLILLSSLLLTTQFTRSAWRKMFDPALIGPMTIVEAPPAQKDQLDEVVRLMLQLYQTLAAMHHFRPQGIQLGPHNVDTMLPLYRSYGLDPAIVYLYQNLPYIDVGMADQEDFLFGGYFADYRQEMDLHQSRDPLFAFYFHEIPRAGFDDENGPYMRPWMTPLSLLGNHESVIIYDAKRHRIWVIDQINHATTDPGLKGVENSEILSRNENSLEHVPSRPAGEALQDITDRLRSLDIIPGGGERDYRGDWDPDKLRALYTKHGWPDSFDGDEFLAENIRRKAVRHIMFRAEQPLFQVEQAEWHVKHHQLYIEHWTNEASKADKTEDEKWVLLWQVEEREWWLPLRIHELRSAVDKAAILCPGGICVTPEALISKEVHALHGGSQKAREELEKHRESAEKFADNTDRLRVTLIHLRHAEKDVRVHERAVILAEQEAEDLRPGLSREAAAGQESPEPVYEDGSELESMRHLVAQATEHVHVLNEWPTQVPSSAASAREHVYQGMKNIREQLERLEDRLRTLEAQATEHGPAVS